MALVIDPAGNEVRVLKRVAVWRGKRVLEIGCGNGRLTLRLAGLAAGRVDALDPDAKLVATARRALAKRFRSRIRYAVGDASQMRFPADTFDIVLFGWAL